MRDPLTPRESAMVEKAARDHPIILDLTKEPPLSDLPPRQTQCLELRQKGLTQHQIAAELGVSRSVVARYLEVVRGKGYGVKRGGA